MPVGREDGEVDWTRLDVDNVYGNGSYKGWCNLDVQEVQEHNIPLKVPQCFCKYDGFWGVLCDLPTESFCINQCSNRGLCRQGLCAVSPSTFRPFNSSILFLV